MFQRLALSHGRIRRITDPQSKASCADLVPVRCCGSHRIGGIQRGPHRSERSQTYWTATSIRPLTAAATDTLSAPARVSIVSRSSAGSVCAIRTEAARPATSTAPPFAVAVIVSTPAVPSTWTVSASPSEKSLPTSIRQVHGDVGQAGAGEVVDRDAVRYRRWR